MTGPPRRYFTADEIERLIPTLETLMGKVMEAHAEATRLRSALQAAQRKVMLSGGARLSPEFWRSRKRGLEHAQKAIQRELGQILGVGGVPKDLDLGLVDFPALLDGQEIQLCWRVGEKRVRFWHRVDEGYTSRKPLPGAEPER